MLWVLGTLRMLHLKINIRCHQKFRVTQTNDLGVNTLIWADFRNGVAFAKSDSLLFNIVSLLSCLLFS